ncbi:DNA polymerase III subunit delta' [Tropicimonas sp. IMCC34043]|uniref:DNA polymerase III subunit delta' n=1 Tax=Tropicimonas sp. IMCC34043 TaxID=2248760 RepID=UPI000E238FF2|nr:DNA polymerase III subunit delta' [Tropicimonas sp. IMCC34043]
MSDADDIPEPDRLDGAPHPRSAARVFGQSAAEAGFLDAVRAERIHHAWLITGPRGIGKATLAWRLARFLLATPVDEGAGLFGAPAGPDSLDIPPDDPVARRLLALSEPRLFLLRRPWDAKAKRLRQEITVDEARRLKGFFALSSADGGRRVVIIDAADEMNPSAANAVLKLLEEPPARAHLLLISHQPSRLLPTIRSRCRVLRCAPLTPDDLAAALSQAGAPMPDDTGPVSALAAGSAGTAFRLLQSDGLALYADLVRLFSTAPGVDRPAAIAFANRAAGPGKSELMDQIAELLALFLSRLARAGLSGPPMPEAAPGEAAVLARLCPDAGAARRWATLSQELDARLRHGMAVNLDPAALLLDTILRLDAGADGTVTAPA